MAKSAKSAAAAELPLPKVLRSSRSAIEAALGRPIPGNWSKDRKFQEAEQPQAILEAIVDALAPDVAEHCDIVCLFAEEPSKVAVVKKLPAEAHHLTGVDFVIVFSWTPYRQLSARQRVALVDHELQHCGYDLDKEKAVMLHHDIEEFFGVVQRWGPWDHSTTRMAEAFAAQGELFGPALVDEAAPAPPAMDPVEAEAVQRLEGVEAPRRKKR